ncbi:Cyclin-L1-1 [Bienertia sinuspersici]
MSKLKDSPSRKDGIDEETEITLRIYGCDLIQESGILLKLPQAVMATGQFLSIDFTVRKSFGRFNVKRVAASCVWLASKLEESPRKLGKSLLFPSMNKYSELKMDLIRTERHLLKEMGFICHVEHPHKFISNYLATLETPVELRQDAWNLANDSLRTTLCVRFKSEVVACGVVYAAARRFGVPLPENPPWWMVFDADISSIEEVCRVLAHLYTRPKAKYIPVCKEEVSFTSSNKSWDTQTAAVSKEGSLNTPVASIDTSATKTVSDADSGGSKDTLVKQALDKMRESKRSDDESKDTTTDGEGREDSIVKSKLELRTETSRERSRDRDRERERDPERDRNREKDRDRERIRDREKQKSRERERERDSGRERERVDTDREFVKERSHRSRDKAKDSGGHSDKSRHHSSRDRERDHTYLAREKDRYRHHMKQ